MSSCADDPGILTHPALANGFRSIGEHLKLPFSARAWARCNSLIARRLRGNHAAPQTPGVDRVWPKVRSGAALDPRRWLFAATLRCAKASASLYGLVQNKNGLPKWSAYRESNPHAQKHRDQGNLAPRAAADHGGGRGGPGCRCAGGARCDRAPAATARARGCGAGAGTLHVAPVGSTPGSSSTRPATPCGTASMPGCGTSWSVW